jgi:hypothetical protein
MKKVKRGGAEAAEESGEKEFFNMKAQRTL